jgi:excisionase family DNA binding protein
MRDTRLATTEEVSEYLNVPVNTLYDWRRRGLGPKGSRVGRFIRYRWSDVDSWLDRQAQGGSVVASTVDGGAAA